jgi:hypothetical protein
MLRTLQAANIAGIWAMAVHAKDDAARAFYERFGFAPAAADAYQLFVLRKDVRAIFKQRNDPIRTLIWLDLPARLVVVTDTARSGANEFCRHSNSGRDGRLARIRTHEGKLGRD